MSKTIEIQVVIDTEQILKKPGKASSDKNAPTPINYSNQYMIVTDGAIKGQGSATLNFKANVGDIVRLHGSSASNNFENEVLIYDMVPIEGSARVLEDLRSQTYTKSGVTPHSHDSVLPEAIVDRKYWFLQGSIANRGTEKYWIRFALYQRDQNGEPTLKGYYAWDPEITVNG